LSASFSSQFKLLCVTCPEGIRWQRLRGRYPNREDFHGADAHSVEQHIDALCGGAFAALNNEGSLEELYRAVEGVLGRIRNGGLS
jgi:dephospho-CoA kinase